MSENLQDEQTELSGRSAEAEADPFYTYVRFIVLWVGIPVLLLVATRVTLHGYWSYKYERELQALRDRGVPVNGAELQKRYDRTYPDQQPLYSILPGAFEEKNLSVSGKNFPVIDLEKRPVRTFTQEEVQTIRSQLPKYRKWIKKIRNAEMKAPEMDYEKTPHRTVSSLNNRAIAQLLVYQGVLAIHNGKRNELFQILETMYRRVRYLMKPADGIAWLSAYVFLEHAFVLHIKALNQKRIGLHQLKRLQKFLRPENIYGSLRRVFEAKLAKYHQRFNSSEKFGERFRLVRSIPSLHLKNQANLLRDFQTVLKYTKAPYFEAKPALDRLKARNQERWNVFGLYSEYVIFSGTVLNYIVQFRDQAFVQMKLLELATRARQHYQRHGEWPDLQSWVARITDPFTGSSCRVKTSKEWIRMYSAGKDQTYDQGASENDVSVWIQKRPSDSRTD